MRYLLIILFILVIQNVYATCSEGQIDINSAQKEELVEIIYIGEVRAEQLIELRPFESVDDLIRIKGIGEVYLSKIKEQELACVNGIEKEDDEKEDEEKVEEIEEVKEAENNPEKEEESNTKEEPELEIIKLNTQTIKTEDNKEEQPEKSEKNTYAIYSFVFFCVLLGFLFVIKKIKFRKDEFD